MEETIYNKNKTMKMLGEQKIFDIISKEGIAGKDFAEVLEAHIEDYREQSESFIFGAGLDFFTLGYIYGQRKERARKKGLSQKTAEMTK